jgi:hypothetical protein
LTVVSNSLGALNDGAEPDDVAAAPGALTTISALTSHPSFFMILPPASFARV